MATPHKKTDFDSRLASNRKAFHQYEIIEKMEAGIILTGAEVKSARAKQINLKPAYVSIQNGEAFLKKCHISAYNKATSDTPHEAERDRKLLLNKIQIAHLDSQLSEHGLTVIPLNAYLKKGKIKIEIGLGRGKKLHDKRQDLKRKAQTREISRHFRQG
ncbi:SsrA-binding protein SmpB [Candidatus Peregrinibacteria bacterium]|nr:SsrA-binding protein SmpB [Candidatus Peregrinibacteria bacterium]